LLEMSTLTSGKSVAEVEDSKESLRSFVTFERGKEPAAVDANNNDELEEGEILSDSDEPANDASFECAAALDGLEENGKSGDPAHVNRSGPVPVCFFKTQNRYGIY
jgi:hypothetical protein